ncbi:putative metallophosphoesterase YhaO [Lentibacillus sp. JNUCC-1]|uniref:metallophosphoesterase family protein n=1 Tax=Lentibacillus sp. JNUCC-1 TaxID=2654513 RepID=UPI0012E862BF|nr:DNA repair exonuclease [Lentibacillus sp. JNUCC-1]MUV36605.1 putative metallophosphoesterase YhaO [Lentibacillus sp. JNUCC-1]
MAETHISFIHAADLHLDSPFKGLGEAPNSVLQDVRESTFKALQNLVIAAIEHEVDFVLISGDVFDQDHQSLKAQVRLRTAFETLEKHGINVYMLYGNHDYTSGNKYPVTYPENVYIFPDEEVRSIVFHKKGIPLAAIYGFSYEHRSVTENKTGSYYKEDPSIPYHIAMLHGSLASNTEHDVYAPFQLKDMMEVEMDYWALGHIHKREILHTDPAIVYPGNTQGRSRKETGEKGCYYVKMTPNDVNLTFMPLNTVTFREVHVATGECDTIFHLEEAISSALTDRIDHTHQLIYLSLSSTNRLLDTWEQDGRLSECMELINEKMTSDSPWQYIYQYRLTTHISYEDLYQGSHFAGELLRELDEAPVQSYLDDLYRHRHARKYLKPINSETEQALKEKAKQWLVQALFSEGRQ